MRLLIFLFILYILFYFITSNYFLIIVPLVIISVLVLISIRSLIDNIKLIRNKKVHKNQRIAYDTIGIYITSVVLSMVIITFLASVFVNYTKNTIDSYNYHNSNYYEYKSDYEIDILQPILLFDGIELCILFMLFCTNHYISSVYEIDEYYAKTEKKSIANSNKSSVSKPNSIAVEHKEESKINQDTPIKTNEFKDIPNYKSHSNIIRPKVVIKSPTRTYKQKISKFDNLNPESLLHELGYKAGKTGLSLNERRKIIKYAINNCILSKQEIINILQRNIAMHKNNPKMKIAIQDWQKDLLYVKNEL